MALDHWIACAVLRLSEERWKHVLRSHGDRAGRNDVDAVRASLFPETAGAAAAPAAEPGGEGLWRVTLETADEVLAAPGPTARLLCRADVDGPDGDGRTLASFAAATGAELVTVTDGTWWGLLQNVRRRPRPRRSRGARGCGG